MTVASIAHQQLVQKLQTRDFASIEDALHHFISSAGDQADVIASSCLACAGPVVDNTCAMTNLKWVVDGEAIAEQFGMRTAVRFLFSPNSHAGVSGLLSRKPLEPAGCCTLNPTSSRACVALELELETSISSVINTTFPIVPGRSGSSTYALLSVAMLCCVSCEILLLKA